MKGHGHPAQHQQQQQQQFVEVPHATLVLGTTVLQAFVTEFDQRRQRVGFVRPPLDAIAPPLSRQSQSTQDAAASAPLPLRGHKSGYSSLSPSSHHFSQGGDIRSSAFTAVAGVVVAVVLFAVIVFRGWAKMGLSSNFTRRISTGAPESPRGNTVSSVGLALKTQDCCDGQLEK
jgi:hypothetical protein